MALYQSLRNLWLPPPDAVLKAQTKLLQHFVQQPLITRNDILNSVDTGAKTGSKGHTIVFAHGFGSGLGFFFRSYDALFSQPQVDRVVAFDWLGMGGSPRPNCCAAPRVPLVMRSKFSPMEASDFFVDSMEEWRQSMQLESFTLVGHSLGGYLAARYALKYPKHVTNLVLASPAGIPEPMVEKLMSEAGEEQQPTSRPLPLRVVQRLWSSNFTPQQIVRAMGPRGQSFMRRVVHQRFGGRWNETELNLISDYLWTITVAPASGEYALNSVLQLVVDSSNQGVFARNPLAPLLPTLDVGSLKILFGDQDWLHTQEANAAVQELQSKVLASGEMVEFEVIRNAGHHLYLDNTQQFHDSILDVLK